MCYVPPIGDSRSLFPESGLVSCWLSTLPQTPERLGPSSIPVPDAVARRSYHIGIDSSKAGLHIYCPQQTCSGPLPLERMVFGLNTTPSRSICLNSKGPNGSNGISTEANVPVAKALVSFCHGKHNLVRMAFRGAGVQ
jgi:hypothetical protein